VDLAKAWGKGKNAIHFFRTKDNRKSDGGPSPKRGSVTGEVRKIPLNYHRRRIDAKGKGRKEQTVDLLFEIKGFNKGGKIKHADRQDDGYQ